MWVELLAYHEDNNDFRLSIHSGDIGIQCKIDLGAYFTIFIMWLICLVVLYHNCTGWYNFNVFHEIKVKNVCYVKHKMLTNIFSETMTSSSYSYLVHCLFYKTDGWVLKSWYI